jgi:prepilin-type N-terminal cleavage/methylation domain-containing protein
MKRSGAKRDKGYSLVEMIIVLAIIAVVSGMSMLSITMIHSAKVKNASITFNSEVSTLITKSKNMNPVYNGPSGAQTFDGFALKVYKKSSDTNYYCNLGYYNEDDTGKRDYFMFEENEVSLSKYAEIKFTGDLYDSNGAKSTVSQMVIGSSDGSGGSAQDVVYIVFDKRGVCLEGYGEYAFCKKRGGNQVARVVIRQNGSHFSR